MQYAWFIWSIILLLVWVLLYFSLGDKKSKKEMLIVSLWTSLLGFTEPLFVPSYWSPPSLFDLALKTRFDIESIIFAFGIGGLAVVVFEKIFKTRHIKISGKERKHNRHKYHLFALLSAPIILIVLLIFTDLNSIYSSSIALIGGGLLTWYCRPDLKKKMFTTAILFSVFYFIYFSTLVAVFPGYVEQVWNLSGLTGILVVGIPLEELMFAFAFGFLWSSVYEHVKWYRITN